MLFLCTDLEFLVVTGPGRACGVRPLEKQELCEEYHAENREEHDEYEEADVGALFGAVADRARAPLHRAGTALASAPTPAAAAPRD